MTPLATLALLSLTLAQDTRVILLGTGTPNPEPERSGPAVAVVSGDRIYLVDSGPGVVRRAAQAGLNVTNLTRIFLTHLHSDHTAGLPDAIFTPAVGGRAAPLDIWGPPGTRAMVGHLMEAWKEDIHIRLHGGEPAKPEAYVVRGHDAVAGEAYRDEQMRVVAFEVNHGTWKHAYGYRFEARDKVVVLSGDTTYSEGLIRAAQGADILVHEVYSRKGWEGRTPEWRKYHAAFHTSGIDVGRVAAEVKPRVLVLYHLLPMGQPPEEVLAEVRENFKGDVRYGKDLDVVR